MSRARRLPLLLVVLVASLWSAAPASAAPEAVTPELNWHDCRDGFECATARVPRDYAKPGGARLRIALIRLPASDRSQRVGSLFVNFGGPGGPGVSSVRAAGKSLFGSLNDRFDIVGFDPRGVGESEPSIDCKVDQEARGVYSQPFTTPLNLNVGQLTRTDRSYVNRCRDLNPRVLPYVSTANVARDLDLLRRGVGDRKLSYLGFSYGTFLGATYASMFPGHYRALVLDGALDADQYINRPQGNLQAQTAGFERAIGRFLQACAADQVACSGFGGRDPSTAMDELIDRLDARPLNVAGRRLDGDDARAAITQAVYSKSLWGTLGEALARADAGDGGPLRAVADSFYGRNEDGTYDPLLDRYFTISALEQRYPRAIDSYLENGERSWASFEHSYFNAGYTEYAWGVYPVRPRGVFRGPFRAARGATPPLVVATTYDPATPYRGSQKLVRDLGNATLLTMSGDGHTAYGGESACIDAAVDAYLERLQSPAPGTRCKQETQFEAPQASTLRSTPAPRIEVAPHMKPLVGSR